MVQETYVSEGVISMSYKFKEAFSGFGTEILESIRASHNDIVDDAIFEERFVNIEKTTSAMLELKIEEEQIIRILQKYWDLRLSEAKEFIRNSKESNL
jgi:hypothetical protein